MGNIREPEVDALFTHFIDEYKGPVDRLAVDFWECLKQEKRVVSSTSNDNDTNIKRLYREVTQNPWLRTRFFLISLIMFSTMVKKIMKVLVSKKVMPEFTEVVDELGKIRITTVEFDEFAKLYFIICSPYPEYRAEVWLNVVKIKKAIMLPNY